MARPSHCRCISASFAGFRFAPAFAHNAPDSGYTLPMDCLEAVRLCDCLGLDMAAAAAQMCVSRHTLGRLLRKGRKTIACAICEGKPLDILPAETAILQKQKNGAQIMSESIQVAVPSEAPGGLEAKPSAHFGHCAAYTVATVQDGAIGDVKVVPNNGHEHGGCVQPVQELARDGVKALLAGGMGMRPLNAMQEAGIAVYYATGFATVKDALEAFAQGKLQAFGSDQLCKGCGGHH